MYHFGNLTHGQLSELARKQLRNPKACAAILDEITRRTAKKPRKTRKRVAHTGELV